MAVFQLEDTREASGYSSVDDVRVLNVRDQESLVVSRLQAEVDSWYAGMKEFAGMDPSDIFMRLAAYSARASEIRTQAQRTDNRRLTAFRTKELDPFLDEVDRQFKLFSRIQSVRDMEARLSGGAM